MNKDNKTISCHIVKNIDYNPEASKALKTPEALEALPVVCSRNLVLFPGITMPLTLVRESSKKMAELAHKEHRLVGLSCQKNPHQEAPTSADDLCTYGMLVEVLDIISLPDGSSAAVVQGDCKYRVKGDAPRPEYVPEGVVCISAEPVNQPNFRRDDRFSILLNDIKRLCKEYVEKGGETDGPMLNNLDSFPDELVINYICTAFPLTVEQKIELLGIYRVPDRGIKLLGMLNTKIDALKVALEFRQKACKGMERGQREAYMREEMDALRRELYGDEDPSEELRRKAEALPLPDDVRTIVNRDLAQMSRTNPSSPDFAVLAGYLDTLIGMPWGISTELATDIEGAREILEEDHYGLTKVKDRILEQIAVIMNNPQGHAPILCLVGPPGVGKTSLGQSVARAMGRKYQRVSFGGLHDEAEIRGHRRTYIGAMPGRVISAVKRAGSMNPVLLLDEIDKIGADYKGDPAAALLEVLDPEQNCHFHDNYLDVDFDLSNVLFIATANTLQTISQPLLDRMEVIELSGYATEEKIQIARRHLIVRVLQANNLPEDAVTFTEEALVHIIDKYTAESGVRQLEKNISKVVRRHILDGMLGRNPQSEITPEIVAERLGIPTRLSEHYEGNDIPGVVTGMAWTAAGGEILFIEAATIQGKDCALTLTGNLGDVMKESAQLALRYVQSHAAELGIDSAALRERAIHIHVPAGAIPKDGPSAGAALATAIVSALTGRRLRPSVAMTGEITLRGRVTPIGGVKEKILAAKRAGITDIILPEDNRRDVAEIDPEFLGGLTFHYFDTLSELLAFALPAA